MRRRTCCRQRSSDMVRSCLERASSSSSSFQLSPSPGDKEGSSRLGSAGDASAALQLSYQTRAVPCEAAEAPV